MENFDNVERIGPLPGGDRRGTSGAGAGRHSMRTASGRRLNRRVTITQDVTADNTNTNTPTNNTLNDTGRSVLREMLPATTLAGRSRQRMKWTDDVNRQLLRCYYIVTNCETNLTGYRPALLTKFTEIYPDLNILTEQRLADQIRVIHRNNRIPVAEREIIKREIASTTNSENNELSVIQTPSRTCNTNI